MHLIKLGGFALACGSQIFSPHELINPNKFCYGYFWERRGVGEREGEGVGKEFRSKGRRLYFSIFLVATGAYSQGQNKASPAEEEENSCSSFHKRVTQKSLSFVLWLEIR